MTREEAIDLLDNLIGMIEDSHNADYDTAFKMAIKSLEQWSVLDKIKAEIINNLKIMDICNVQKNNGVIIHTELSNKKVVLVDSVIEIIDKYKTESED